ncbi:diphthine--ammonia ligase isoform X6 [Hemicordylus capensis]|uniref:diphthine--ammonia ligase isoform X6 n=1 Tax=Hemicordylus capensis TaxID=884348 RepID=UPI002302421A|nr:diphthine--ammonia ligase isoform X6 [Hemicordylus capensis]
MKVVALISGGKDSCYNMMHCIAAGHQIVALANLRPARNKEDTDELDSYMYQTVGHHAIDLYAEAMGLPLYRHTIKGTSVNTSRVYTRCEGDEVEDLYQLLKLVKDEEGVEGVSVGAILSDYQRVRVEDVCKRLALQPLAYLWRQNQETLLREMISSNIQAIIIKVAAFGLDPDKHLGKTLAEMEPYLLELSKKYGVHICGEGGEYETFTLDCPLFKKKIVVDSSDVVVHSADAFAPVAYLRLLKLHLEDKVHSLNEVLVGSCSCEIKCFEDKTWPAFWEQKETLHITWHSSRPTLVKSSKPLEFSGKSGKGYQWIAGIGAQLHLSEGRTAQDSAKNVFSSLQAHLNSKGLDLTDIILVHLYVKSMKDFVVINSVYMTVFDLCPPARVCVEAPLPEGMLFQMDCLAHHGMISDAPYCQKQVMHVQSISHWAPANIGPYSQCIQVKDEDIHSDVPTVCGELAVIVVPSLPRAASIEWHVIAVVDEQQQRQKLVLMRSLEYCQIKCEAVQSHPACGTAIVISLSMTSLSTSTVNLDRVMHDMVELFKQAAEKISEDDDMTPLAFRTFYRKNIIEREALQAGLQEQLEEQMGKKVPALIMVPVVDLSGNTIIQIVCWLSQ